MGLNKFESTQTDSKQIQIKFNRISNQSQWNEIILN